MLTNVDEAAVLAEFLSMDCDAGRCSQLLEEIRVRTDGRRTFYGNLFDVLIDADRGVARVDPLMAADPSVELPLDAFRELLMTWPLDRSVSNADHRD